MVAKANVAKMVRTAKRTKPAKMMNRQAAAVESKREIGARIAIPGRSEIRVARIIGWIIVDVARLCVDHRLWRDVNRLSGLRIGLFDRGGLLDLRLRRLLDLDWC